MWVESLTFPPYETLGPMSMRLCFLGPHLPAGPETSLEENPESHYLLGVFNYFQLSQMPPHALRNMAMLSHGPHHTHGVGTALQLLWGPGPPKQDNGSFQLSSADHGLVLGFCIGCQVILHGSLGKLIFWE